MIAAARGDIVVLADRAGRYTGKLHAALVVQADAFSGTDSVLVCLITSSERDAPLLRVSANGSAAPDAFTPVAGPDDQYTQQHLLGPLGMTDTAFRIGAAQRRRYLRCRPLKT